MTGQRRYDAVVFDLLTALLDSWTLWNDVAGSEREGLAWRRAYLGLTYAAGPYRPYESIVREAAVVADLNPVLAERLVERWDGLQPWPEVAEIVPELARRVPLGVATNCSVALGTRAVARAIGPFTAVTTAESAGFYKPRPEPYRAVLTQLGTDPSRTLFVAGSAADVPGSRGVGMPVFWHNRMGLQPLDEARPDFTERSLHRLLDLV